MRRDPALRDLARDHHRLLMRCLKALRAPDAATLRAEADRFVRAWDEDGRHHAAEEERVLLAAAGLPADDPDVARLHEDHRAVRDGVERVRAQLAEGRLDEDAFRALAARLRDHVRFEDFTLYGRVERALDAAGRRALARASATFRMRERPPGHDHCSRPDLAGPPPK